MRPFVLVPDNVTCPKQLPGMDPRSLASPDIQRQADRRESLTSHPHHKPAPGNTLRSGGASAVLSKSFLWQGALRSSHLSPPLSIELQLDRCETVFNNGFYYILCDMTGLCPFQHNIDI